MRGSTLGRVESGREIRLDRMGKYFCASVLVCYLLVVFIFVPEPFQVLEPLTSDALACHSSFSIPLLCCDNNNVASSKIRTHRPTIQLTAKLRSVLSWLFRVRRGQHVAEQTGRKDDEMGSDDATARDHNVSTANHWTVLAVKAAGTCGGGFLAGERYCPL